MNEDGRPDAEEPWEPAYDEVAEALNAAPQVRAAIRRLVTAWLACNPAGVEEVERGRAMAMVWKFIEDHTTVDPRSPWAGTLE